MLFNSLYFLMFFFGLVILYFAVPQKFKWPVLLGASIYFYMCWTPLHIIVLLAVTVISYFTGLYVYNSKENKQKSKKLCLAAGIVLSFAFLAVCKYANFFMSIIYSFLDKAAIPYTVSNINIALPVGISFFSFKAVSYIMDAYRGKIIEKNFFKYLLYVSFFPQVASGPIERSTNLIPQLTKEHKFNPKMIESGLSLMLVGYFKKMVVADNISGLISTVKDSPSEFSPLILFAFACLYSFQIFCDFSGYSDIAIGCTRVFGIETAINFDHPYSATSIASFWRKWHISLSSWFRDYLYIPLGGNRKGTFRKYINLMIVFLVSGLWHGSAWNFIFWGFLHGMYQIIGAVTLNIRKKIWSLIHLDRHEKIHNFISVIITFTLVTFAWIFFNANSIGDGFNYIKCMFTNIPGAFSAGRILTDLQTIFTAKSDMFAFLAAMLPFILFEIWDLKKGFCESMSKAHSIIKILFYACMISYIVIFAASGVTDFIYTRF